MLRCAFAHAGAISFWNAEERHLEEDSKTHRSPLTSLTWNVAGDKLFTSDENAKLSVRATNPKVQSHGIVFRLQNMLMCE